MNAARVVNIEKRHGLFSSAATSEEERRKVGSAMTFVEAMNLCAKIERENASKSTSTLDEFVRSLFSPGFSDQAYAAVRQDVLGT